MAKSKYSKKEIEHAYKLYEEHKKLSIVSSITGINRRTLSDNFDKYGFEYKKVNKNIDLKMSIEDIYNAYDMYKNGLSAEKIAIKYGVSYQTIFKSFKNNNLEIRNNKENSRKYNILNENYFESIDTPNKAYWLGFIYADGYISIRNGSKSFGMALSICDEDSLKKLNEELSSDYKIYRYDSNGNKDYKSVKYSRLLIRSDKIVDDLINHGVVEHKTNIIKPPKLDYNLIRHFIRGYMDGDGCIGKVNGNNYYVSFLGTDDLLIYICNYLLDNNLIKNINKFEKRKNGQIVSSVKYGGNIQSQKILDHLYGDAEMYLSRKYNRYKELKAHNCCLSK